uniref:Uncharacterized protein n=1 Tax=Salix viminalis TaxID=40686 RepID=A0A6N2LK21_SALVM
MKTPIYSLSPEQSLHATYQFLESDLVFVDFSPTCPRNSASFFIMSTVLWCTHCARKCQTLCEGDFLSCSWCGKVLSMLSWHKKFNLRNPRCKRTKRRRNDAQVADDESCVTAESSVNTDDGLSDTARKPV